MNRTFCYNFEKFYFSFQDTSIMDLKCRKAINPDVFWKGMHLNVRICRHFKEILGIDNRIINLANLFSLIVSRINQEKNVKIPRRFWHHFDFIVKININNYINVLAVHMRFIDASLSYCFINPDPAKHPQNTYSVPRINIQTMNPVEKQPEEFLDNPPIENAKGYVCKTCNGFYLPDNYKTHAELGPFAPNHSLAYNTDVEIQILVTINILSFKENRVECRFCPAVFNLLFHSSEMNKHAIGHANQLLNDDVSLLEAKEVLWEKTKDLPKSDLSVCLACNRIFPSPRHLFLHISIFDHTDEKNICLQCRICIRYKLQDHILAQHPEDAVCPYMCQVPSNEFPNHFHLFHNQASNNVPQTEVRKLKEEIQDFNYENEINGLYGIIKFDRHMDVTIKSQCLYQPIIPYIVGLYKDIDAQGWIMAENIINSRIDNKLIRIDYIPHIILNPLRFVSKVIMKNRQSNSEATQIENYHQLFDSPILPTDTLQFLSQAKIRYTRDLLSNFDAILLGNNQFRFIGSEEDIKLLNLSTAQMSGWKFNNTGVSFKNLNLEFDEFVMNELAKLDPDCSKTIFVESSLQPYMDTMPKEQRVHFLRQNVKNLAVAYLVLINKIHQQFRNVVVTTTFHSVNSCFYNQELEYIKMYNQYLRVGALHLQLGLLECDAFGINSFISEDETIYYKTDPQICKAMCDNRGTLTTFGRQMFRRKFKEFEYERTFLNWQAENHVGISIL